MAVVGGQQTAMLGKPLFAVIIGNHL